MTPAAATPSGYGPSDLRSAYKLTSNGRRRPDDRHRRRLRRPERREPTWRLPRQFGLPPAPRPTAASARSTRTAARPPAARTPAGRRRSRSTSTWSRRSARIATSCWSRPTARASPIWRRGEPAAISARTRSATATAAATQPTRPVALQPPRHRHHRGSGDNGYGVEFPAASQYVTAVGGTSVRTRRHHARLDRDGLERRGQWLQPSRQASSAATPAALAARWPTCRRSPTRTPASRSTTRTVPAAGWSSAARAWRRRSSPASTRWPATRQHHLRRPPLTARRPVRRHHGQQRQLRRPTCARRGAGYDGPTGLGTPNGTGGF